MAGGINGCYARDDFIAGLDECRTVGQRQTDLDVQLAIEFPRLADVLAALPEVEICGAEHVAGFRKDRLAAFREAANVVWMAMCEDNHIYILRPVAGGRQSLGGLPRRQPLAELLVLARERTIACVE